MKKYVIKENEISSVAYDIYKNAVEQVCIEKDGTFTILGAGQNVIKKDLSLRQVEEYFENVLDIYDMDCEINQFVNQYFGTSIGESIRNKRMNVSDDDYDSIKEIYKEVYKW